MNTQAQQTPVTAQSHSTKAKNKTKGSAQLTGVHRKRLEKELEALPQLVKENFKTWATGARPHQLQGMRGAVLRKDMIIHAATGAGKTGIAAGPFLLKSSTGKVTLMVSPLLVLHEEHARTFHEEFGLRATKVDGQKGGCSPKLMQDIVDGVYQIVLISPEMLLSRRFIDGVLRKPAFGARCLSIFIDEAHCISQWGAMFRKKYASLGILRGFLPKSTPFIAVSATLTPRVWRDIVVKLQMDPRTYEFINIGNNRCNVSQIVRSMQHAMNTYRDIDFIVPNGIRHPDEIKKSFIYSDDVQDGTRMTDYLNMRVPEAYQSRGVIRPYNAVLSRKCRDATMKLFMAGVIRVLVCTDAAGMGCNIPDIDLVIQWKAPANLSTWVQRAGRAARGPGRDGVAIMLVEKSSYTSNPNELAVDVLASKMVAPAARGRGRGGRGGYRGGRGRAAKGPSQGRNYATDHGQQRGAYSAGKSDEMPTPAIDHVDVPEDAHGEGIYQYIQAQACRRDMLNDIFKNPTQTQGPSVPCCDICDSSLFNLSRPPIAAPQTRAKRLRRGNPVESILMALSEWRKDIKKTRFRLAKWSSTALLPDDICEVLASIGPVVSKEMLANAIGSLWIRWEELGDELFTHMKTLDIPPLIMPPKAKKRSADELEGDGHELEGSGIDTARPRQRPRADLVEHQPSNNPLAAVAASQSRAVVQRPPSNPIYPTNPYGSSANYAPPGYGYYPYAPLIPNVSAAARVVNMQAPAMDSLPLPPDSNYYPSASQPQYWPPSYPVGYSYQFSQQGPGYRAGRGTAEEERYSQQRNGQETTRRQDDGRRG